MIVFCYSLKVHLTLNNTLPELGWSKKIKNIFVSCTIKPDKTNVNDFRILYLPLWAVVTMQNFLDISLLLLCSQNQKDAISILKRMLNCFTFHYYHRTFQCCWKLTIDPWIWCSKWFITAKNEWNQQNKHLSERLNQMRSKRFFFFIKTTCFFHLLGSVCRTKQAPALPPQVNTGVTSLVGFKFADYRYHSTFISVCGGCWRRLCSHNHIVKPAVCFGCLWDKIKLCATLTHDDNLHMLTAPRLVCRYCCQRRFYFMKFFKADCTVAKCTQKLKCWPQSCFLL